MRHTTLTLHSRFQIAPVDPRLFGGFVEYMGRAIYEGVYDPRSVHADADGLRGDVLAALADALRARPGPGRAAAAVRCGDDPALRVAAHHAPLPRRL